MSRVDLTKEELEFAFEAVQYLDFRDRHEGRAGMSSLVRKIEAALVRPEPRSVRASRAAELRFSDEQADQLF